MLSHILRWWFPGFVLVFGLANLGLSLHNRHIFDRLQAQFTELDALKDRIAHQRDEALRLLDYQQSTLQDFRQAWETTRLALQQCRQERGL